MERPRRFRWGFVVLGVILVGLIAWAVFGQHKKAKPTHVSATPVTTAKATVRDVPMALTELGSAIPWQGVTIRTQVNGKLLRVAFQEGSYVKAGDLLAEIDSSPYRATLMQAQGALKRDEALLEDARLDLKRYQTLVAQDSLARQQLDTQAALVKQDEGLVLIDKGQVAAAQVNVNWCRIVSPVTGRVGVRLVDPGNIVSTSDTAGLAIVNQITPIAVTFTVPEGDLQRVAEVSHGFTQALQVQAASQENGANLGEGEVSITDNRVDPATGMVLMKARFPNEARKLWPSQFVNVRLTLQTLSHAVVIPANAVNQGPNGAFAYVVGADHKAQLRPIKVAATQDAQAVISSGLKEGEVVVTDGQLTLKPGATVSTRPPAASAQTPGKTAA
jgi:multidrug efflux system membrane fusion protein